ncbi:hypothetical protein B0H13DRAFT_1861377 [Mycena leptocephala]|nr:hypothetical protein B0H13DRAFT_1861377 [Mycena leptocephala]
MTGFNLGPNLRPWVQVKALGLPVKSPYAQNPYATTYLYSRFKHKNGRHEAQTAFSTRLKLTAGGWTRDSAGHGEQLSASRHVSGNHEYDGFAFVAEFHARSSLDRVAATNVVQSRGGSLNPSNSAHRLQPGYSVSTFLRCLELRQMGRLRGSVGGNGDGRNSGASVDFGADGDCAGCIGQCGRT